VRVHVIPEVRVHVIPENINANVTKHLTASLIYSESDGQQVPQFPQSFVFTNKLVEVIHSDLPE
jgi:hypothetical protein